MKIVYTKHAKLRIKQRKLSTTLIQSVITSANKVHLSFGNRLIARKNFNGKTLEVVYKKEFSEIIVLTAYWL